LRGGLGKGILLTAEGTARQSSLHPRGCRGRGRSISCFVSTWRLLLADYTITTTLIHSRHLQTRTWHMRNGALVTRLKTFLPIPPIHTRGFPASYFAHLHRRFAQSFSLPHSPTTHANIPNSERCSRVVPSETSETSSLDTARTLLNGWQWRLDVRERGRS
jgi:hypothetical protein